MKRNTKPRMVLKEPRRGREALENFLYKQYRGHFDFAILKKHARNSNPILRRLAKIKLRQISLRGWQL